MVFPELALTMFFPRWHVTSQAEVDAFFEHEMPGRYAKPLFDAYTTTVFDFARHRRPEHYRLITERTGAIPPG